MYPILITILVATCFQLKNAKIISQDLISDSNFNHQKIIQEQGLKGISNYQIGNQPLINRYVIPKRDELHSVPNRITYLRNSTHAAKYKRSTNFADYPPCYGRPEGKCVAYYQCNPESIITHAPAEPINGLLQTRKELCEKSLDVCCRVTKETKYSNNENITQTAKNDDLKSLLNEIFATRNTEVQVVKEKNFIKLSDGCDAIPASLTAPRTGQKAWDKCIEYQERFVYPCEKSSQPGATPQRGDYCTRDPPVLNDTDSSDNEYNYVVSLAYRKGTGIAFYTGGTIISEKYVLTVAQSAYMARYDLHSVYLGAPVKNEDINYSRLYMIKSITIHPEHRKYVHYHDIALVETVVSMELNKYIRPACLHTGEPLNYDEATLISRNYGRRATPPYLSTVTLTKISIEEASKNMPNSSLVPQGYVDEWQMCYHANSGGDWIHRRDSGCPLQVKSDKIKCMNVVIGLSSIGKLYPSPMVCFTRVAHYLPWIESIVWP